MKQQSTGAEGGGTLHGMGGPAQDLSKSELSIVQETLADIQRSMGSVPEPFLCLTEESVTGLWQETKALEFSAEAAVGLKYRELISLGVGAQIPCRYTVYFELRSARADGATAQEQTEAVLMAGATRHWSTILNGSGIPMEDFRRELGQILDYVKAHTGEEPPPREAFVVRFGSAAEAYKDIEQTLGIVPQFFMAVPERALPGAWSQFKGVELNPYTAIPPKEKELIGLAVAGQIPCHYCTTFHRELAFLHGATSEETQEALAIAALMRHWSTLMNGLQLGEGRFERETEQVLQHQHGGRAPQHA